VHEWAARAAAAGLARSLGAPILDAAVPTLISAESAEKTLPDKNARIMLSQWVLVPQSPGTSGFWFTTKGLWRYLRGELVHQRQLMVKYSVENDRGREFPWAYVTSWSNPDVLLGSSSSQAMYDERVRLGLR